MLATGSAERGGGLQNCEEHFDLILEAQVMAKVRTKAEH